MDDALFSPHPADLRCSVEMDGEKGGGSFGATPNLRGCWGRSSAFNAGGAGAGAKPNPGGVLIATRRG